VEKVICKNKKNNGRSIIVSGERGKRKKTAEKEGGKVKLFSKAIAGEKSSSISLYVSTMRSSRC